MASDLIYLVFGVALLLAVVLPAALSRLALSAPVVLIGIGCLIGLLPLLGPEQFSPVEHRAFTEHLTELTVLVALMGVGLALDRPLSFRRWRTFLRWSVTWRLLAVTMPLSIAGVAVLGWWVMGLGPAAALLLGAALSPTDPVLASDVQVEGPGLGEQSGSLDPDGDQEGSSDEDDQRPGDEQDGPLDEPDEVRFALTSEAGLNDALAFPFVYGAIYLATKGPVQDWGLSWLGFTLVGKVLIGAAVGVLVGRVLAKAAFAAPRPSLRIAERGEPLLAIAALLTAYGLAEVAQGYGFLAVFAAAMTLRSRERGHEYHQQMHGVVERLEQLLTLSILLLLGVSLTNGLLESLTWRGVVVALALVLVIRPLAGWVAVSVRVPRQASTEQPMTRPERLATAFFGVRGVGSIYYLAYATGQATFPEVAELWSTVAFAITVSVVVHGVAATPVMSWIERRRQPPTTGAADVGPVLDGAA
ncbi:cation:proton antiporter [Auraticoccus monumenti]|uniref:NhaP-type Na+/H+ or K+/H+ antiporter n=1 Tax=Auraticoccus monumenti TaxID=675864 RepID=A0A1G7CQB8_9ACTN|nr:cation:proton antiporter [Auraticoccus monumenti]SDE41423.1 NhaP-type Na+/H+ or K+/H+ antiporter [Auraticoccus monumenti]